MRVFWAVFLITLFSVGSIINNSAANSQETYVLHLQGYTWSHSTLSALVVTAYNESWWSPNYLNDSLRAIGQWNEALRGFAENYSEYSYMLNMFIRPQVANETQPNYDLYINWSKTSLSNSTDEIGLATTFVAADNTVRNCQVVLASRTTYGNTLSDVDMQNIVLHELGHALGLGHSNYTGDMMYPVYSLGGLPQGISTLDAYGVATVFAWMTHTQRFYPVASWLNQSSVILPASVIYSDLPVSTENQPPQSIIDNPAVQFILRFFTIISQPIIAVPVIIAIVVLTIIAVIPRKRKASAAMVDS